MKVKTILERPRLEKVFSAILVQSLLVVTAGAGYGKTTAAKEYLRKAKVPFAWVALTSEDEEVFWDKLCAAIEPYSARAAGELRFIGVPASDWLIAKAVKTIRLYCLRPFIICLDDYQCLARDSLLHRFLENLVLEEVPDLHILLLARTMPPFRVATLISKKLCMEVKPQVLNFTMEEIGSYLQMRGLRLLPTAVQEVYTASEGWIAAIYLMSEGIRAGRSLC